MVVYLGVLVGLPVVGVRGVSDFFFACTWDSISPGLPCLHWYKGLCRVLLHLVRPCSVEIPESIPFLLIEKEIEEEWI